MKDLVDYIVKQLVTKPEEVVIDEQKVNGEISLLLTVNPSDMGLIIGKNGQTIKALRRLLTVRAMAEDVRVNLQLNEVNQNGSKNSDQADSTETTDSQSKSWSSEK